MPETNGSGGADRRAEMKAVQADIRREIQNLMRVQVAMNEALTKLTQRMDDDGLQRLEAAQLRTEASLHALILTVDGVIRGRKHDSQ